MTSTDFPSKFTLPPPPLPSLLPHHSCRHRLHLEAMQTFKHFSMAQVVIGYACLTLGIVLYWFGPGHYYQSNGSYGYWGGILISVVGIIGPISEDRIRSRIRVKVMMAASVVSAFTSVAVFALGLENIFSTSVVDSSKSFGIEDYDYYDDIQMSGVKLVIIVTIVVLSVAEAAISMASLLLLKLALSSSQLPAISIRKSVCTNRLETRKAILLFGISQMFLGLLFAGSSFIVARSAYRRRIGFRISTGFLFFLSGLLEVSVVRHSGNSYLVKFSIIASVIISWFVPVALFVSIVGAVEGSITSIYTSTPSVDDVFVDNHRVTLGLTLAAGALLEGIICIINVAAYTCLLDNEKQKVEDSSPFDGVKEQSLPSQFVFLE